MRDIPSDTLMAAGSFPGELLIWLSPSFPVGGFAYSQGLESAVDQGWVNNKATLQDWVMAVIRHGALRNDLIAISLIMRAESRAEIDMLVELACALQPSAERSQEALEQGRSFVSAYRSAWVTDSSSEVVYSGVDRITLPAAVALAARSRDLTVGSTLEAYAIAFCNNLLSAAIRLSVVGQIGGQRVLADLLPVIRATINKMSTVTVDDFGSATYGADIASMLHETQATRLFRS